MKQAFYRKSISFLMVIAILTISVTGFCRGANAMELSGYSGNSQAVSYLDTIEKGCSTGPADKHSVPDHCDSSCNCPCHAPLTVEPVRISCSQKISSLTSFEPFKAIPEVYLSRFIPPQNLA